MPSLSLSLSLSLSSPRARLASAACVSPRVSPRVASPQKTAHRNRSFSAVTTRHTSQNPLLFSRLNAAPIGDQEYGNDPRSIDRDGVLDFPSFGLGGRARAHTRETQWGGPRRRERERRRRREDLRRRDLCASAFTAAPRGPGETPRARALERERERRRGGSVLRPDCAG